MARSDFIFRADRSERYTIIEITIIETPRHAWGIRGRPGDEIDLGYKVEV